MEKLNIIDELTRFLNKNMSQIGREIGKRDGTILYNIQTGRNKMSRNLAAKLKEVYPQLNESYLLTGKGTMLIQPKERCCEGEMMVEPKETPVDEAILKQMKLLERLSEGQDAQIQLLKDRVKLLEQRFEPEKNLITT